MFDGEGVGGNFIAKTCTIDEVSLPCLRFPYLHSFYSLLPVMSQINSVHFLLIQAKPLLMLSQRQQRSEREALLWLHLRLASTETRRYHRGIRLLVHILYIQYIHILLLTVRRTNTSCHSSAAREDEPSTRNILNMEPLNKQCLSTRRWRRATVLSYNQHFYSSLFTVGVKTMSCEFT